jgi:hypothetical protein
MKLVTSLVLSFLISSHAFAVETTTAVSVTAETSATTAASTPAATPVASAPKALSKDSQTNMAFDDLLIQGQYHFSDEAVVTVEDDKVLDALLGVRKDFKDRIQQSSTR